MASTHSIRIGNPVAGEPFAQVLSFAHVEHCLCAIAHEVNAGGLGQTPEKVRTQAFHQWTRIWKQQHLAHG